MNIFHNLQNRSYWDKSINEIELISGTPMDECMVRCTRDHEKYERTYNEKYVTRRDLNAAITFCFTPEDLPMESEDSGELLMGIYLVAKEAESYRIVFIQQIDEKGTLRMMSNKNAMLSFRRAISRLKSMTGRSTV